MTLRKIVILKSESCQDTVATTKVITAAAAAAAATTREEEATAGDTSPLHTNLLRAIPRTVLPHPSSTIIINIPDNTEEVTIPMPHLAVLLPPITAAVATATRLRRTRPLPD